MLPVGLLFLMFAIQLVYQQHFKMPAKSKIAVSWLKKQFLDDDHFPKWESVPKIRKGSIFWNPLLQDCGIGKKRQTQNLGVSL